MKKTAIASIALGSILLSCGGGGGGGPGGPNATDHLIANDQYVQFPAGSYYSFPFSVSATAETSYTVMCRSSTSCDTFTVGLFIPSEWSYFSNGQNASSVAPHNQVTTASDSASLPPGSYVLGLRCDNVIENCQVSVTLDAYY